MSQTTHPKILKIREIKDWLSRGFYAKKLPAYLQEDYIIRSFLNKKLKQASVENIEIERTPSVLKVIIKTARPALVIGRGGKGVEELKASLIKELNRIIGNKKEQRSDLRIEVLEIKNPWNSAELISQWVAGQIEKMVPFRRALKMAISKAIEQKEVQGIKITVAGRLNGAEIARTEWLKEGKLPRQTIRSVIEYGFNEANCTYGNIGVKVWLYKGERFD